MEKTKNILIVDDDQDLLDMYNEFFRMDGFKIITTKSGIGALDICKKEDIKLIISDSNMPGMNGLELLTHLRSYYQTMPLFYLLTGAMEIEESEVKNYGVHALISKPFDLDEIMRRIKEDLK